MAGKMLSLEQAAALLQGIGLQVTVRTLRFWRLNKTLPFTRIGKRVYIDEDALMEHVNKLQSTAVRENREFNERRAQAVERLRRHAA